jgi:hypothetical protein
MPEPDNHGFDTWVESKFPSFTRYLKEQFGERVRLEYHCLGAGKKNWCISIDGKYAGCIEAILLDGGYVGLKAANIKSEFLPGSMAGSKMLELFCSCLSDPSRKELRKDSHRNIPFP